MFDYLRGGNDNSKFERIFSEAPAWLLKFTAVEWDAKLLGFKLRKLVGAPALGRKARLDRNKWPFLPEGTIDGGGPCSEPDEPWEEIVKRRCRKLLRTVRRLRPRAFAEAYSRATTVLVDEFDAGETSELFVGFKRSRFCIDPSYVAVFFMASEVHSRNYRRPLSSTTT